MTQLHEDLVERVPAVDEGEVERDALFEPWQPRSLIAPLESRRGDAVRAFDLERSERTDVDDDPLQPRAFCGINVDGKSGEI